VPTLHLIPPEAGFVKLESGDQTTWKNKLLATSQQIKTFKALANVRIKSKEGENSLRYAFVLNGEKYTRLEILPDQTFYTLGLLVINPQGYTYLDPEQRKAWQGNDALSVLRRFLHLPLESSDLLALITARIPQPWFGDKTLSLSYNPQPELLRADLLNRFVLVSKATSLISRVDIIDPLREEVALRLSYHMPVRRSGVLLPEEVEVEVLRENTTLKLSFIQLAVNAEVDEGLFKVNVPEGYTVQQQSKFLAAAP
jgi:hypothetical protein